MDRRWLPGCAKVGVVCDFKAFMKEISVIKKVRERDANGDIIRPYNIVDDPNWDKVNWAQVGEGANLETVGTEFDKVGFKGRMENARIFKNWSQK